MTESNNTRRTPFRARREKDEENIRIGISQGDVNGIGYEVDAFSNVRGARRFSTERNSPLSSFRE